MLSNYVIVQQHCIVEMQLFFLKPFGTVASAKCSYHAVFWEWSMPTWWILCRPNAGHASTQRQLGIHTPRAIMWAKCDKDFLSSASSEVPGRVWSKNAKTALSNIGKGEWRQLEVICFFPAAIWVLSRPNDSPSTCFAHVHPSSGFTLDQMPPLILDLLDFKSKWPWPPQKSQSQIKGLSLVSPLRTFRDYIVLFESFWYSLLQCWAPADTNGQFHTQKKTKRC